MMAPKHLHELLKEDQEPFLLKNYISNRRRQLKTPSPKTTLQLKKQKPPPPAPTNFPVNLCKNACFLSFQNTPDIRKSPLFEFASPAKSPHRSSNTILLHIPAKTASLLLDAALRIQKQSKTKPHCKNNSFGLFGSFFKRLTQRNRNRNRKSEIEGKVSVKDILRWDSSVGRRNRKAYNGSREEEEEKKCSLNEVGFTCSCNGRPSSAVWSESNEDKSLDMETSSSGHSCDSVEEEAEFVDKKKQNADFACFDGHGQGFFCESPFRFVLQRSPSSSSSGRRTPEFSSPAVSPSRHGAEDKENNGRDDGVNKFQSGEEEEEKEQNSPVSVLDPPFEDDDDDGHENDDDEGRFDLECSYANVQRTKLQLLDRLRRFEQLAELDPVELEKIMLDQEDNECETFTEEDDCEEEEDDDDDRRQVPEDLKRLVYDLIREEERELNFAEDRNMVMRRVCRKLELWNGVESNTIDMMIEEDLSKEGSGRKKNAEETRELAGELELAIFCFLVEEFSEELVC